MRTRDAAGLVARNGAALGEIAFMMRTRGTQKSWPVRQQLWTRAVEIADGKRGRISATCVMAREIGAPEALIAPAADQLRGQHLRPDRRTD